MTPSVGPNFSLLRTYVFATSIGCEKQSMLNLPFSSAGFAVCLYAHVSPNLHPSGRLQFCTFGNMPIITGMSLFLKFEQSRLFAFPD